MNWPAPPARAAADWDGLRRRLPAMGADRAYHAALERRAAIVLDDFDKLVEEARSR